MRRPFGMSFPGISPFLRERALEEFGSRTWDPAFTCSSEKETGDLDQFSHGKKNTRSSIPKISATVCIELI